MSGTVRESPADFRNGDLISRLLAATPPYQTNSTFVPPGLYFSEMLKRFVQAKSSQPPLQSLNKRGRKRSWKDCSGGGNKGPPADPSEACKPQKKPADFTSIPAQQNAATIEPHHFPLWYPPFYPAAYPPAVYFKSPDTEPLNLQTRGAAAAAAADPLLQKQDRHCSAFRVPGPCGKAAEQQPDRADDNRRGTSYLMGNLTEIYRQVAPQPPLDDEKIIDVEGDGPEASVGCTRPEEGEKKDCKDLTALIGLELVVDYVKHGHGKGDPNEQTVKCCQNS